jgi:tRNA threonylcarbamoyladenosine biosynthesis protein TsaB
MPIVLAFDTATETATCALVSDGDVLGERRTSAGALLRDVEDLTVGAGVTPSAIDRIAVGRGPGRYTSLRMGLVTARVLSFALGAPVNGVSTLDALAAGAPGALPVVDARRREVFVLADGPACLAPEQLELEPGRLCIGDGAVRYRDVLERAGAEVPRDDDPRHIPWARYHAFLAVAGAGSSGAEPIYLRAPDADKALAGRP